MSPLNEEQAKEYWRRNLSLMIKLMVVWFVVSFGFGILLVDVLNQMREHHRFLRGMSVWVGFKQTGVKYKRAARYAGETHYPLKKMIKLATTAITGFSFFPLQAATYLGFIASGVSIITIRLIISCWG